MIKFENVEVMNFEGALRGMRNPLNSWDKADSVFTQPNSINCTGSYDERGDWGFPKCTLCCTEVHIRNLFDGNRCFTVGPNDINLAQRLIKAGPDHRKFLRQIFVSVDITAPLYWWKEFDTYKVSTVANSCSTMHTIHKKEFTREDFSVEHLYTPYDNEDLGSEEVFSYILIALNRYRKRYLETKNKDDWWQMIQLLPTSYNQKRTVTLNYETLRNIYGSRRNHKLDEWSIGFMDFIDSLPYSEELIKY